MAKHRKNNRPADPMEIALRHAAARALQRDPAQWGIDPAAMALGANAAVAVQVGASGAVARARRQDVFDLFLARGRLTQCGYDAIRRLQDDIAILHRTIKGGGDIAQRVDASRNPQGFSDHRHQAGQRIEAALNLAGAASARLLAALCEPDIILGRGVDWRQVVAREADERLPDAQGAILRTACENLAGAYTRLDRERRRGHR